MESYLSEDIMNIIGNNVIHLRARQFELASRLYELLEMQDDVQEIMDIILQITDLNKYRLDIDSYIDGVDISDCVVEGPHGISILHFVIWLLIGSDNLDVEFDMYPSSDIIVEMLVRNGAKSNPVLYNWWLKSEEEWFEFVSPQSKRKYNKIKKYLGLQYTFDKLKNVRNKNRRAKTIQRRVRGNRSRLYNSDNPTQYSRSKPILKNSIWNIIDEGLKEDGIGFLDREKFKRTHFDKKWES